MQIDAIDAAVRNWLGFSMPPVRQAFADSAWRADGPAAYCSRCGESVGPGEATAEGCGSCRGNGRFVADRVVRLGIFAGDLREWILRLKYHGWTEMGRELGRRLGEAVAAGADASGGGPWVIVPVPMPWQRRLYRGIDHARVIADGVAGATRGRVVPMLRKLHGPPQVTLPASLRRRGAAAKIQIRRSYRRIDLSGERVLLVDDVRTTGGTLRRAAGVLRRLGASHITAAVIAVSDDLARRTRAAALADQTSARP